MAQVLNTAAALAAFVGVCAAITGIGWVALLFHHRRIVRQRLDQLLGDRAHGDVIEVPNPCHKRGQ